MKPLSLQDLIQQEKQTEKRIRENKKSSKALKKARRKLQKALRANTLQSMQIAIGMAQVALDKAKFLASVL